MICRRLGLGFLALLTTSTLAFAAPVAQVVKLSGTVQLIHDSDSSTLTLGASLEEGDTLKTDASSRVRIQLLDGSTVNIGSGTEFVIDDVESDGPGKERDVGLDLWLGVLLAHAAPATPDSRFEIRTKKATTAVRGTQWGIYAEPAKSDVVVLDGTVGVESEAGGDDVALTKSIGVTVTDAGLGQPAQWSQAQIDALIAATNVPGEEVPFTLKKAESNKKKACPPGDSSCDRVGGGDKGGRRR